jgi:hypothetical protein
VVGKQLSALLQILRAAGVTSYRTKEITLELGPVAPKPRAPGGVTLETAPAETGDEDPEDEEGDPRFLLEKLGDKYWPAGKPRANPKRHKAPDREPS